MHQAHQTLKLHIISLPPISSVHSPSLYKGLSSQQISGTFQKRGKRQTEDADTHACLGESKSVYRSSSI